MAQSLAQKLVARAAGRPAVTPGEIVTCRDGGLLPHLEKMLARGEKKLA